MLEYVSYVVDILERPLSLKINGALQINSTLVRVGRGVVGNLQLFTKTATNRANIN